MPRRAERRLETGRDARHHGVHPDLQEGRDGPAGADVGGLERYALRALASGDLDGLRTTLAALPASCRSPLLEVARLEAAVRCEDAQLSEIDVWAARLHSTDPAAAARFGPWLDALRAEFLLWRCDLEAVLIAVPALRALPTDTLPPIEVLVPRARLARIVAFANLFLGTPEEAREALAACLRDFGRAGWDEERALTLVVFSLLHAGVFVDEFDVTIAILEESAAALERRGSVYLPHALVALAAVRFMAGDVWGMHAALDGLDRGEPDIAEIAAGPAAYLRALATFLGAGGRDREALDALWEASARFRASFPEGARILTTTVGHVLADLGQVAEARSWAGRTEFESPTPAIGVHDRRFLAARLALLESPSEQTLRQAREVVASVEAAGLRRDSGGKALRLARDCERCGLWQASATLRTWGLERLPPPRRRSLWELLWQGPLGGPPPPEPTVQVLLLGPRAEVVRGGKRARLQGHTARLLAVLVALGGHATSEQLIDRLWPDVDTESGRNRLNVTLFRLRRMLGVEVGSVLVRHGDVVDFSPPEDWVVDAWRFRSLAAGGRGEKLAAFAMYNDHLCSRQLAYDDALTDARTTLRAIFVDVACDLLDSNSLDVATVADAALRLELRDPLLVDRLVPGLEGSGHAALARRLADVG